MKNKIDGTWKLNVQVGAKRGVATFELKEGEGGSLSGTYTGEVGTARVAGTVVCDAVEFSFDWHGGKVRYTGAHADGKLSGTCTYGVAGDETFEGGKADA